MIDRVLDITAAAGRAALSFYEGDHGTVEKSDGSPITLADEASHRVLVEQLGALDGGVPVLSEESAPEEVAARRSWRRFWCVDPLDGTKEFIKRTGQFTVNVALIEDGRPVLGVVHVPVQGVTYYATAEGGAYKRVGDAAPVRIGTRGAAADRLSVVASRDHAGPEVAAILDAMRADGVEPELASMGSSLKFCLVAEGAADFYPRTVPTMEWDTAAAQCVVEVAGGRVMTRDGAPLGYNKDDLRNPSVFAVGDPELDWQRWVSETAPAA